MSDFVKDVILSLEEEFYEWCNYNSVEPVPYNVISWLLCVKTKEIVLDEELNNDR